MNGYVILIRNEIGRLNPEPRYIVRYCTGECKNITNNVRVGSVIVMAAACKKPMECVSAVKRALREYRDETIEDRFCYAGDPNVLAGILFRIASKKEFCYGGESLSRRKVYNRPKSEESDSDSESLSDDAPVYRGRGIRRLSECIEDLEKRAVKPAVNKKRKILDLTSDDDNSEWESDWESDDDNSDNSDDMDVDDSE